MTKPHSTLRPSTNIILIIIWASLAIISSSQFNPWPLTLNASCAIFGVLGGIMQMLSLKEGHDKFINAQSMIEVRAQLKNTKWGKRYIYFVWSISIVIFALSIFTSQPLWAWLAGYFTMMFFRDVMTLKSIFELAKLNVNA